MIIFDTELGKLEKIQETEGKLAKNPEKERLMSSVMAGDKEDIEHGKISEEAINRSIGSFSPDLMFESLVDNYSLAEKLYGETIIREITGFEPGFVSKNVNIPEFRREMKKNIEQNIKAMKDDKVLTKDGELTKKAIELASLVLYIEELDKLNRDFGENVSKELTHYGERAGVKNFKKGDRYKDINIKKSIRQAVKRGHKKIHEEDLKTSMRQAKSSISLIYGLDSSASMKGDKLKAGKRAGIALAFKAIENKDKVGLIVFGEEVKEAIPPTSDFGYLLEHITTVAPSKETNFRKMIIKASELFPKDTSKKHLIIITDALPTSGNNPEKETLRAAGMAKNLGITLSMIGISLDKKGEDFAKELVQLGEGRLHKVTDLENMDHIVLEDYYSLS